MNRAPCVTVLVHLESHIEMPRSVHESGVVCSPDFHIVLVKPPCARQCGLTVLAVDLFSLVPVAASWIS